VKLFYSPTSPYVRKIMACAIARDIDNLIETLPTNPHVSPPELLAMNPLSKVPCLVTDDGLALFDSPVICEYLDSVGHVIALFPSHGAARWRALKQQAMGDGILDAAVLRRMEAGKPQEAARDVFMARQKAAVERTLDMLEADPPAQHLDIGTITVGSTLGYLDLRFAAENWRQNRPRLGAWWGAFALHPCMARTAPKDTA
jgi:glutathione S-transferase